ALFAFLHSFNEAVVAIFIAGRDAATLPKKMFESIRLESDPVIAVVSTLLTGAIFIGVLASLIFRQRPAPARGAGANAAAGRTIAAGKNSISQALQRGVFRRAKSIRSIAGGIVTGAGTSDRRGTMQTAASDGAVAPGREPLLVDLALQGGGAHG